MIRKIVWLPEAEYTFNQNIEYLSQNWTINVINGFIDRVDEVIQQISTNPYQYPFYKGRQDVRKCIVTKHITLYFQEKESQIELLTFWNNYLNPNKQDF